MKADWVSFEEAVRTVAGAVAPLGAEPAPLAASLGRVLAENATAPIDVPPWTNSAMDGFATRAESIVGATVDSPVALAVVDDIAAGMFPSVGIGPGEAARVMTGAPVPEGADTVIRVEHTDGGTEVGGPDGRVRIFYAVDSGKNLRQKGEDLRQGDVALAAGEVVSAAALGVLASLGYAKVIVRRRPVIALLTSGNELVDIDRFDEVLAGRKIVTSNSYTLAAQLAQAGCDVRYLGIAEDTPDSLRTALQRAKGCDGLITSAGVSVGEHDHVRTVLAELDTSVNFWRVRIRPGSPFAFGRVGALGDIPWFGLPGNPVSSMVTFELFARPALLRMGGHRKIFRQGMQARLQDSFSVAPGLTHFIRVRLAPDSSGGWEATPTGPQGSGILTSLARADGLLILPEDSSGGRAGETYPVIPFDSVHFAEQPTLA